MAGNRGQEQQLLPDSQSIDEALISLEVAFLEIVEKPSPLPYQLQEASTGMVIFRVNLEVLGEIVYALA